MSNYYSGKRVDTIKRVDKHKSPPTINLSSLALWLLVLALMLVYIGGYLYSYFSRAKITETVVTFGSVDQTELFSGIIIRDEAVYKSDAGGVVVYNVNDYDRVKKGGEVCSIHEAGDVEKIEENLAKIDKSIISMQESRQGNSLYDDDIKNLNNQIKKTADELSFSLSENNLQALYTMKDKVTQTLNMRNQIQLTENRGSVRTLVQERSIVESQLLSAKRTVSSSDSGIVCYIVDGMENILTVDGLSTITKEQTQMKVNYEELSYKEEVNSGDTIFKIVKSNNWYIAAYIDKALTDGWAEEQSKTIYIKDGDRFDSLSASIYKIENAGDSSYVVFITDKELIEYLNCRNLTFKVEQGVVEGLKIPNSTIVDKTLLKIPNRFVFEYKGRSAVTKTVQGKEEMIFITITESDDDYSYVLHDYNNLRYGDLLVNGGETTRITESENIKGVYVTNSGSTVFKRIYQGGNYSENATHTILDPVLNKGLKVQDRIVTDAKNIDEKQMVY